MDDFGLKIGESSTFPTDIYLKVRGKKLRAVRTTDLEKLTIEEIKDLSREILIQRKLRSPYIVEVLSCRVMGSHLSLETGYCAYGSCRDLLHAHFHHGFDWQTVSLIARGVALGLEYIHSSNIIHRSIRASHVLITDTGMIKLSGFRYAIEMADIGRNRIEHSYLCDPEGIPWKSPELLEQNCSGYNIKSDMYSFGIFLCELFNGAVPFSDLGVGTLIMLEKLRGKQPLLMDKSTLESNPLFTEDEKYIPFLKRKIPKTWHLLISTLTTRCPEKRPTAKAVLKQNAFKLTQGCLKEKLEPINAYTLDALRREEKGNRRV